LVRPVLVRWVVASNEKKRTSRVNQTPFALAKTNYCTCTHRFSCQKRKKVKRLRSIFEFTFMLMLSPRQQQILAFARKAGSVNVDGLATHFEVTPQTIRKDLNELCDARHLTRTHGGAMLSSGVENVAYEARRQIAATEKQMIGRFAASLIPNNCSLFINIGTTTEEVARALIHHEGLLVITNNIHVASILAPVPKIEVIVVGGAVRKSDGGIVGETAVDTIRQFKVDHAVMGVSAIDEEGALLDFDYREVRAAQAIMGNSRNVILAADNTKFARTAPVRIGHMTDINVLVTDRVPPEPVVELCRTRGVKIELAIVDGDGLQLEVA
jgi:DeoR family transcriptional regulator, glycerol-3-phosphate regulon repressor